MFRLLKFLFGPRLGRIRMHETSVTLYNIDAGVLRVIKPDDSWAGNVKEWSNGRFRLVRLELKPKTRRPIERFSISYENTGLIKTTTPLEPFLWEKSIPENEREPNDCGIVTV